MLADCNFKDGFYDAPLLAGLRAVGRVYAGWAYSQDWYRNRGYEALGFRALDEYLSIGMPSTKRAMLTISSP